MSIRTANTSDFLADETSPGAGDDTFSVIDRHSSFDGSFHADRDLRIEGEVKGTIACQGTLFVAQGATVTAKVEAENISVAGDFNGEILCRGRLQMMPSGRVRAKVYTETLVINEGAYYEGQLEMAPPPELTNASPPRSLGQGGTSAPPRDTGARNEGDPVLPRQPRASRGGTVNNLHPAPRGTGDGLGCER